MWERSAAGIRMSLVWKILNASRFSFFIDILYRCTKNDQDAQVILNARRNDTNYVDILNEVIAYHDARASWSVPFYASLVRFIWGGDNGVTKICFGNGYQNLVTVTKNLVTVTKIS